MIIEISSTLETFKTLRFHAGLNVLLAERHRDSTDTDTRNSAGKSSVVEIVHFLLGGTAGASSLFAQPPLDDHEFSGRFEFDGKAFDVTRGGRDPDRVFVDTAHPSVSEIIVSVDEATGRQFVGIDEWRRWLGHVVFKLPLRPAPGSAFAKKGAPSFRSLFGYFARRKADGGFEKPTKYVSQQSAAAVQVPLCYLFDLDWEIARSFEDEREKKAQQSADKKRAKARQDVGLDTAARIRSALAKARKAAQKLRSDVENFRVAPHYEEMAAEAASVKVRLDGLSQEAAVVESALKHLKATVADEEGQENRNLDRLYANAGVELPGSVRKVFADIKVFHESVVTNRRFHLEEEIRRREARAADLRRAIATDGEKRSEILDSLRGKGAFSDLVEMQKSLSTGEAKVATLSAQLAEADEVAQQDSTLRMSKEALTARLMGDFRDRYQQVEAAVLAVTEAKEALYADREGAFEIIAGKNGPEFKVSIAGDRSGGISNMEIFCLDYALLKLATERLGGPGFLIHDSHLFDGVDERQVVTAITIGGKEAERLGAQYIVLMNSDEFTKLEFEAEFEVDGRLLPVVLEDTPDGGLFGTRFG